MTYESIDGGKVKSDLSGCVPAPTSPQFLCHAEVEERLVEALRYWWRSADQDARFSLGGRISSVWRQALDDRTALIELVDLEAAEPRPLPLSRGDMQRRDEATEWLLLVPERDRRLVIMGLGYLARGDKRIPWLKVAKRMRQRGADGLRMRYSRAITAVCHALNGGKANG